MTGIERANKTGNAERILEDLKVLLYMACYQKSI